MAHHFIALGGLIIAILCGFFLGIVGFIFSKYFFALDSGMIKISTNMFAIVGFLIGLYAGIKKPKYFWDNIIEFVFVFLNFYVPR